MNELKELRQKVSHFSILIVDDEADILEGSVVFMKKFFDKVTGVGNAQEALEHFQHRPYDIVLSDVQMPGMDGWELIKQLRALNKKLFTAIMTGSPEEYKVDEDLCDIYLQKPLNIEDITRMLKKLTAQHVL